MQIPLGLSLPFFGTTLGAFAVLFLRRHGGLRLQSALLSLAAGIMAAASVWSLLLPALAQASALGRLCFLPVLLGFWLGVLLLCPRPKRGDAAEPVSRLQRTRRMVLAVILHNIPEGMAVGVAFAAVLRGAAGVSLASAMALSLGIAIQNVPEGAIISMPLHAAGLSRGRALWRGVLSGVVEPLAALATLAAAELAGVLLPWLLGFAAGAMLFVTVLELLPSSEDRRLSGALWFCVGFCLMMALDCAFS